MINLRGAEREVELRSQEPFTGEPQALGTINFASKDRVSKTRFADAPIKRVSKTRFANAPIAPK